MDVPLWLTFARCPSVYGASVPATTVVASAHRRVGASPRRRRVAAYAALQACAVVELTAESWAGRAWPVHSSCAIAGASFARELQYMLNSHVPTASSPAGSPPLCLLVGCGLVPA